MAKSNVKIVSKAPRPFLTAFNVTSLHVLLRACFVLACASCASMFVRVRDICACYLTDISHTSTRTGKDMNILSLRLEVMVAAGDALRDLSSPLQTPPPPAPRSLTSTVCWGEDGGCSGGKGQSEGQL